MATIETAGIVKRFGAVEALSGVDLVVERGELFGLIGPDGGGKSTLLRVLATLIPADSGKVVIEGLDAGRDYREIRSLVGYMPSRFSLYPDLTVEENLKLFAALFRVPAGDNYSLAGGILEHLLPFRKRRAAALSGGMKQKLALCCALVHEPSVLLLDEPTTGVDPVSRDELWRILGRLKRRGVAIVVSTPYMDEARLCDRVALVMQGRFLDAGTPGEIVERHGRETWAARADGMSRLLVDLRSSPLVESCHAFGDQHHVTPSPGASIERLREEMTARGHRVEIREIVPGIEDCFIRVASAHTA